MADFDINIKNRNGIISFNAIRYKNVYDENQQPIEGMKVTDNKISLSTGDIAADPENITNAEKLIFRNMVTTALSNHAENPKQLVAAIKQSIREHLT